MNGKTWSDVMSREQRLLNMLIGPSDQQNKVTKNHRNTLNLMKNGITNPMNASEIHGWKMNLISTAIQNLRSRSLRMTPLMSTMTMSYVMMTSQTMKMLLKKDLPKETSHIYMNEDLEEKDAIAIAAMSDYEDEIVTTDINTDVGDVDMVQDHISTESFLS